MKELEEILLKALDADNDELYIDTKAKYIIEDVTEPILAWHKKEMIRANKYQVHELHKECGKTTDGKQLYWAKVYETGEVNNVC